MLAETVITMSNLELERTTPIRMITYCRAARSDAAEPVGHERPKYASRRKRTSTLLD